MTLLPMRTSGTQPDAAALRAAYAECERLARAHYENFPVASWLRAGAHAAARRRALRVRADGGRLRRRGTTARRGAVEAAGRLAESAARVRDGMRSLTTVCFSRWVRPFAPAIFRCRCSTICSARFVRISRRIGTTRGTSLLDYCRRSANPVGRLVLRIAGYDDARLDRSSDALCTALQLTNFWQDLDRDWQNGRLYVPLDDVDAEGARLQRPRRSPDDRAVAARPAARRGAHAAVVRRGRDVCDGVRGRLRYELRLTWLGGTRILDRLDRVDYDVFTSRPTLGVARRAVAALARVLWRRWAERPRP